MRKQLITLCLNLIACGGFANAYYVSSSGNDSNNGSSIEQAWASISQVNTFSFSAGDSLLFEGGATFTGRINNSSISNGTAGNRITITSYGTGRATISSMLDEGISLTNPGSITISNLIFKGSGYKLSSLYACGIDIYIDSFATTHSENIILDSLETSGYGGWGILFTTDSKIYGYKNLRVTNSVLHDNGVGGFQLLGYMDTSLLHANIMNNENIYIGYVKSYNNLGRLDFIDNWSGSGILIGGTLNGMIEYCEAYNNGKENGSSVAGPVGIFLGDSKFVTIQHCSSHNNAGGPGKRDGGGFDLDQGSYGCVIQYCDSYENQGAGYGLYQAISANPWSNDTLRYNTSTNDGRNFGLYGAFSFWGAGPAYSITNAQVYGNQINQAKAGFALFFLNDYMNNILVHDNTFCIEAPGSYLDFSFDDTPISANATVYNSTFPCHVKVQAPFIRPVTFRGAFAPAPTTMWTSGWTNYDPQNTIFSGSDSIIQTPITTNITLSGIKTYLLQGSIYVKNGATLTIQPGCVIKGDKNFPGSALIIASGSKINAAGLPAKPIVFTSNQPAGARNRGDWGGLIILGKAPFNGAGGMGFIEGLNPSSDSQFGGGANPNDFDSSGVLQFVRIEFAGSDAVPGLQTNGLTFGAVGRGTTVDHIQVSYSGNDGFNWLGGAVNCNRLVSYKNKDDDWNANNGYHGAVQFCLGLRDPLVADDPLVSTSEGLETSNDSTGSNASGFTSALFCNVTEIGPLRGNTGASIAAGYKRSVRFANNSHVKMINSILMDFPTGVFIDGTACTSLTSGNYLSAVTNQSPGNLVFKNNLLAGNYPEAVLEKNIEWNMAQWFGVNKNDSLKSTLRVLDSPYYTTGNNVFAGDYRPSVNSPALINYNWNDSAFYHFDSAGNKMNLINCPAILLSPGIIVGATNPYSYIQSGDVAKYYISTKSIFGVLQPKWTVPTGVTIQSGQGTDTLFVKFASTFISGNIVAQNISYCGGVVSGVRILGLKKIAPVIYTFIGDGNWNIASNWSNGLIPPASLPALSEIIISPAANGTCILNVPQNILPGGKLTVQQDKNFIIQGNLTVK